MFKPFGSKRVRINLIIIFLSDQIPQLINQQGSDWIQSLKVIHRLDTKVPNLIPFLVNYNLNTWKLTNPYHRPDTYSTADPSTENSLSKE